VQEIEANCTCLPTETSVSFIYLFIYLTKNTVGEFPTVHKLLIKKERESFLQTT
jgi:hypothetical protein